MSRVSRPSPRLHVTTSDSHKFRLELIDNVHVNGLAQQRVLKERLEQVLDL